MTRRASVLALVPLVVGAAYLAAHLIAWSHTVTPVFWLLLGAALAVMLQRAECAWHNRPSRSLARAFEREAYLQAVERDLPPPVVHVDPMPPLPTDQQIRRALVTSNGIVVRSRASRERDLWRLPSATERHEALRRLPAGRHRKPEPSTTGPRPYAITGGDAA